MYNRYLDCLLCLLQEKYVEARFRFVKDFTAFKKMASFAGWNMVGEIAWAFTGQGVNIILNLFLVRLSMLHVAWQIK